MNAKVFVGNLNFDTTAEEVEALFAQAGEVVGVSVPTDRMTGRPRGFAFVEYTKAEDATAAIERFSGYELGGRKLRVDEAGERLRVEDPLGGEPMHHHERHPSTADRHADGVPVRQVDLVTGQTRQGDEQLFLAIGTRADDRILGEGEVAHPPGPRACRVAVVHPHVDRFPPVLDHPTSVSYRAPPP